MAEWIAGKTFRTEEEACAADGKPMMTDAEKAHYLRILDEWNDELRSAGPGPAPVGGKFSDDMNGTEFEGYKSTDRDPRRPE
ncbi:hypothetical protein [Nocardia cyriacigeorgica]|uniref:Uncharacterized protein n=1 Tax=Nocardia cyriacigeorgica TaxID=135487 RepID=A0A6P1DCH5_9NOCA|nr:hypothetical protein [Nocardia cyriacigeorgica]NEW42507.1 hypothetical protein [Nocardia cyriacigeorgica]NEW48197.1 hypothetical protein [Nocardia cyriacigeorgica]